MKDKHANMFFGWSFFLFGAFMVILVGIISYQQHKNFISDEEMFRFVTIGLILFCSGSIVLCISRIEKAQQTFQKVDEK